MIEYKIIEVGKLKYDRLKSIIILKNELNSFDYNYNNDDAKLLLDSILNYNLNENVVERVVYCLDKIFENNKYERLDDDDYYCINERNFPDNFIPPIG